MVVSNLEIDMYRFQPAIAGRTAVHFKGVVNPDPMTATQLVQDSDLPNPGANAPVGIIPDLNDDGSFELDWNPEDAYEFLQANPLYDLSIRVIDRTFVKLTGLGRTRQQPLLDVITSIGGVTALLGSISPHLPIGVIPKPLSETPEAINMGDDLSPIVYRQVRHLAPGVPLVVVGVASGPIFATLGPLVQRIPVAQQPAYYFETAIPTAYAAGPLLTKTVSA